MTDLVGPIVWSTYQELIGVDAFDTFFKEDLIWKRAEAFIDSNGEDQIGRGFSDVTLKCLIDYNDFRTWPISRQTESGEIDKQTMVVLLSINNLESLGFMNSNGNFDFQNEDRFELDGILYKDRGNTNVAQAQDVSLIVQLVLEREIVQTSDDNN